MAPPDIISRNVWCRTGPQGSKELLHPVPNIVIYPESKQKPCDTKRQCMQRVQELQQEHITDGWPDIKYNFLIGGDAKIYEGMGWKHRGHDTKISEDEKLNNFISVCYIGNFYDRRPPEVFQARIRDFIQFGKHRKYFKPKVKQYMYNPVKEVIEREDADDDDDDDDDGEEE